MTIVALISKLNEHFSNGGTIHLDFNHADFGKDDRQQCKGIKLYALEFDDMKSADEKAAEYSFSSKKHSGEAVINFAEAEEIIQLNTGDILVRMKTGSNSTDCMRNSVLIGFF